MKNILHINHLLLFSFAVILSSSCNNHKSKEKNNTSDTMHTGSSKIQAIDIPKLKEIIIDETYFNVQTAKAAKLEKEQLADLSIKKVFNKKSISESEWNIKILDTLFISDKTKIFILSGETENEHWARLVQYDINNNIMMNELVFYEDFVEYFLKTNTAVKNNEVVITTEKNMENDKSKKVKKFIFNDDRQFE